MTSGYGRDDLEVVEWSSKRKFGEGEFLLL